MPLLDDAVCVAPSPARAENWADPAKVRSRVWGLHDVAQFGPPGMLVAGARSWLVASVKGPLVLEDALLVGRSNMLLLIKERCPLICNTKGGVCTELSVPRTFNATKVWATCIASNRTCFACGDSLGGITVWRVSNLELHAWVGAHGGLGAVALDLVDAGRMVSCGWDRTVKVYGLDSGLPLLATLTDLFGVPTCLSVVVREDDLAVAVATNQGRVFVWQPDKQIVNEIVTPGQQIIIALSGALKDGCALWSGPTEQGRVVVILELRTTGEICKALLPLGPRKWAGFVCSEAGRTRCDRLVTADRDQEWTLDQVRDLMKTAPDETTRTVRRNDASSVYFDEEAAAEVLTEARAVRVLATRRALNFPLHAKVFTNLIPLPVDAPGPVVVPRRVKAPKPKPRAPLSINKPVAGPFAPPFCLPASKAGVRREFYMQLDANGQILLT